MTLPQIAEKPISQEKAAKLIGISGWDVLRFKPLENKDDLMHLECHLHKFGIFSVTMYCATAIARLEEYADTHIPRAPEVFEDRQFYLHHNTYFTARAHAVCAVAEQIYDRKHNEQNTD